MDNKFQYVRRVSLKSISNKETVINELKNVLNKNIKAYVEKKYGVENYSFLEKYFVDGSAFQTLLNSDNKLKSSEYMKIDNDTVQYRYKFNLNKYLEVYYESAIFNSDIF